jgi:hypothetical protein
LIATVAGVVLVPAPPAGAVVVVITVVCVIVVVVIVVVVNESSTVVGTPSNSNPLNATGDIYVPPAPALAPVPVLALAVELAPVISGVAFVDRLGVFAPIRGTAIPTLPVVVVAVAPDALLPLDVSSREKPVIVDAPPPFVTRLVRGDDIGLLCFGVPLSRGVGAPEAAIGGTHVLVRGTPIARVDIAHAPFTFLDSI